MTAHPESPDPSAEPPVLTEVVGQAIPTLTDIAAPAAGRSAKPGKIAPDAFSDADVRDLLDTLAPQLEATLKVQLAAHLDILAKYAVANAIEELKKNPAALLCAIRDTRA